MTEALERPPARHRTRSLWKLLATLGAAAGAALVGAPVGAQSPVSDISIGDAAAVEEGDPSLFPVTVSPPSTVDIDLSFTITHHASGGTEDEDFSGHTMSGTFTIPANTSRYMLPIGHNDDGTSVDDEFKEYFTLTLSDPPTGTRLSKASATGTIRDSYPVSSLTFSVDDASATEGGAVSFVVTASAPAPQRYFLYYKIEPENLGVTQPVDLGVGRSDVGIDFGWNYAQGTIFPVGSTSRTIRIPTVDDSLEEFDEHFTLTIGFLDLSPDVDVEGSATGTVIDNDRTDGDLLVIPADLSLSEGEQADYAMALKSAPSSDVDVTVNHDAGAELSVIPLSVTFTPSNWNQPVLVAVAGGASAGTDHADEVFTIDHALSGGLVASNASPVTVEVRNVVPIEAADIELSRSQIVMGEAMAETYTVKLADDPGGSVTVDVDSTDPGRLKVSPAVLSFDSDNYSTPQTVTVNGVPDWSSAEQFDVTVLHTVRGTQPLVAGPAMTATIHSPQFFTINAPGVFPGTTMYRVVTYRVHEGSSKSFSISLREAPPFPITMRPRVLGRSGHVRVTPAATIIDASNYSDPVTITIEALEDNDLAAQSLGLMLYIDEMPTAQVSFQGSLQVSDNKVPTGLVLSDPEVTVAGGVLSTATYQVTLTEAPAAGETVTVELEAGPKTAVVDSQPTVWFDSTNWNQPQDITVRGRQRHRYFNQGHVNSHVRHTLVRSANGTVTRSAGTELSVRVWRPGLLNGAIGTYDEGLDKFVSCGHPRQHRMVEGETITVATRIWGGVDVPLTLRPLVERGKKEMVVFEPSVVVVTPDDGDAWVSFTVRAQRDTNLHDQSFAWEWIADELPGAFIGPRCYLEIVDDGSGTIQNDDGSVSFVPDPDTSVLQAAIQERIDRTAQNNDDHSNRIWQRALAAVRGEDPPNGWPELTAATAQRLADNHRSGDRTELADLWQDIADTLNSTPPPPPAVSAGAARLEAIRAASAAAASSGRPHRRPLP